MTNFITIDDELMEVIDVLNNITLADSFLKNKTGRGNGEAKLYVGNESEDLFEFFNHFVAVDKSAGFFLKKDLLLMLENLESEFKEPQQIYLGKKSQDGKVSVVDVTEDMASKWSNLWHTVNQLADFLPFTFYRSNVEPPRVYINSQSKEYHLLRDIGIPNISYCTILKLRTSEGHYFYYFRPNVDYSNDISGYELGTKEEEAAVATISNNDQIKAERKEKLLKARVGQGKYREDLLQDMPYCPFTLINDERLLIASHIKPWVKSTDAEKLDPKNGLMLSPTYDKLFDKGFITFNDDGTLIVSPLISPMNQKRLNIRTGIEVRGISRFFDEKRLAYLDYHRKNIFQDI